MMSSSWQELYRELLNLRKRKYRGVTLRAMAFGLLHCCRSAVYAAEITANSDEVVISDDSSDILYDDKVYYEDEDVFKFYNFINAENKDDFDSNVKQYLKKSVYDTGVKAEYGDKLLTLVTCAYHTENGRFVVVARRR